MNRNAVLIGFSSVFFTLAGLSGLSLLFAQFMPENILGFIGLGLFRSFSFSSLYLPLYLAAIGGLLIHNSQKYALMFALTLGAVPMTILAMAMHLFSGAYPHFAVLQLFAQAFTPGLAGVLLTLFSGATVLVLFHGYRKFAEAIDRHFYTREERLLIEDKTEADLPAAESADQVRNVMDIYREKVGGLVGEEVLASQDPILMDDATSVAAVEEDIRELEDVKNLRSLDYLNGRETPAQESVSDNGVIDFDSLIDAEAPVESPSAYEGSAQNEISTYNDSSPVTIHEVQDEPVEKTVPSIESEVHTSVQARVAIPDSSDDFDESDTPIAEGSSEKTESGDFNYESYEPQPVAEEIHSNEYENYYVPIRGILRNYQGDNYWEIDEGTRKSAEVLRQTLEEFGIAAEVTGISKGPVITMFEILPAPGVKLAKITNLADNIALRLAASSVRIVAPIPGKHAVGIEIPNKRRSLVSFGELISDDEMNDKDIAIPIALGKDISGQAQIVDLAKTPHLLIAGATGAGKSVCVNSIISSILYKKSPEEVKMILIDPKIVELKFYNDIPHLLTPVITEPKKAFQALQYALYEMERRYSLLDAMAVRDIKSYNKKIKERNMATTPLPYMVVIVDEFADLMATSGKELEATLARLAAMSRAVGIHLILATQRPSTDVITGLIKANIPSRIAFMVSSKVDSRIILDSMGAEKLLGRGDMLLTSAWDPFPLRMQGAFLSEDEVENIVDHVKTLGEPEYIDDEIFIDDEEDGTSYMQPDLEDPLMQSALEIVVSAGKASASYLQRRLKVGYNRAARMVEQMESMGVVGPQNGSKPREVIATPESLRTGVAAE